MTRDEWLEAFAAELGLPIPSSEEIAPLLEIAALAAHASERTAAPLSCWLAGRSGLSLAELRLAAERIASP
jgi:hypothetical protein